mgnify:CR=1 FL=1
MDQWQLPGMEGFDVQNASNSFSIFQQIAQWGPLVAFALSVSSSFAEEALSPEQANDVLGTLAERSRVSYADKSFEEFLSKVYKEPFEGGKYIVNGDVAIVGEKKLRRFFEEFVKTVKIRVSVVIQQWWPSQLSIKPKRESL